MVDTLWPTVIIHTADQDEVYTKTLGIEWHSSLVHFRLNAGSHTSHNPQMTRALVSDITKIYDVLGWFASVTIKAKILLQGSGSSRSTGMRKYLNVSFKNGLFGTHS